MWSKKSCFNNDEKLAPKGFLQFEWKESTRRPVWLNLRGFLLDTDDKAHEMTSHYEYIKNMKLVNPLSANPDKMVKHIQTIRRQKLTICLSVFDHFVGLALKGFT